MPQKTLQRLPLALAALLTCLSAHADVSFADGKGRLSGFGTIAASITDNDKVEFLTPGQPGHGATDAGFSFSPDTKIGVQADYRFNPMFSATLQVMTKENGKGNWNPSAEWAFIKAQVTPGLSARVGRMGAPFFMISDFRDVNYVNSWVRPPLEVYGQVPISNFDGADVSYRMDLGDTTLTSTLFVGPATAYNERNKLKLNNLMGLNTTAEIGGNLTLRLGYARGKLTINSDKLAAVSKAYRDLAPAAPLGGLQSADLLYFADQVATQSARSSFLGLGATWDEGNWIVSGEFTKRRSDSYVPDTTGWYASVGYRVGKFTPFVYAARTKVDSQPANPIPANVVAGPVTVNMRTASAYGSAVLDGGDVGQKSLAVGVRWDAFKNTAIKAQLESIKLDSPNGNFNPRAASGVNLDGKTVNVLSLAVDFVF